MSMQVQPMRDRMRLAKLRTSLIAINVELELGAEQQDTKLSTAMAALPAKMMYTSDQTWEKQAWWTQLVMLQSILSQIRAMTRVRDRTRQRSLPRHLHHVREHGGVLYPAIPH